MYDEYDEFWCREHLPIREQFDKLISTDNRYHFMLATRLNAAGTGRWLIKPAGAFTSPEHEKFYADSYKANVLRGMGLVVGQSGFVNGNVYAQLDEDIALDVVPDAKQPMWGWVTGSYDKSREVFEAWWKPDTTGFSKAIRFAWRVQGIVAKVAAGDRMYALSKTPAQLAKVVAMYPGYQVDDGSPATL